MERYVKCVGKEEGLSLITLDDMDGKSYTVSDKFVGAVIRSLQNCWPDSEVMEVTSEEASIVNQKIAEVK